MSGISRRSALAVHRPAPALRAATIAVLASALMPVSAFAESGDTLILEPASAWQATYEGGRCRLSRMFDGSGQQHALVFEQTAPDSRFFMSVAGPTMERINGGLPLRLAFGPNGPESEQDIAKERNSDFGAVVFMKDIDFKPIDPLDIPEGVGLAAASPGIDLEAAAPLRQVSLVQGGKTLVFRTGPLAAPFRVLNDCTAHILTTWGIDPEAHRTAQRSTKLLDVQALVRSVQEKYPLQPLMERRGGVVGVAILVDQTGMPTECRITDDSGDRSLNDVACEQLMKARFDPALDASGKPMKSYWMTRITYRIGV